MKSPGPFILLGVMFLTSAVCVQAQEKPKVRTGPASRTLSTGGLVFATAVERMVPGIRSVLKLDKRQRGELSKVREEVFTGEEVKAAREKLKKTSKAPPREKAAARKVVQKARDQAREQIHARVLDADQKELVAKIDKAFKETTAKLASEHNKKMRAARKSGEKGAFAKARKEMVAQVKKAAGEKVEAVLDDTQKERLKKARARAATRKKSALLWEGVYLFQVYDRDLVKSRIERFLNQSEDLRQIQAQRRRIWFTDHPRSLTPERVSGPIK
jgi:hypothetical protein